MAYTLGNKCAKNCCKRTILVQLIVKDVVTVCCCCCCCCCCELCNALCSVSRLSDPSSRPSCCCWWCHWCGIVEIDISVDADCYQQIWRHPAQFPLSLHWLTGTRNQRLISWGYGGSTPGSLHRPHAQCKLFCSNTVRKLTSQIMLLHSNPSTDALWGDIRVSVTKCVQMKHLRRQPFRIQRQL